MPWKPDCISAKYSRTNADCPGLSRQFLFFRWTGGWNPAPVVGLFAQSPIITTNRSGECVWYWGACVIWCKVANILSAIQNCSAFRTDCIAGCCTGFAFCQTWHCYNYSFGFFGFRCFLDSCNLLCHFGLFGFRYLLHFPGRLSFREFSLSPVGAF